MQLQMCEHAGAAFSLILEEKLALGLADAPCRIILSRANRL
jgi:hypothetical protein